VLNIATYTKISDTDKKIKTVHKNKTLKYELYIRHSSENLWNGCLKGKDYPAKYILGKRGGGKAFHPGIGYCAKECRAVNSPS